MLSLITGLGFILLGILPYGFLNFWLLKNDQKFEETEMSSFNY
ncbi:MAG: hypothetical protein QNJ41_26285 [Xenococcaceae cyanobacterium MO_188.B32]|nr:hypothetical protein [Xenococcaceae cyanobacterium MO_188.B32]